MNHYNSAISQQRRLAIDNVLTEHGILAKRTIAKILHNEYPQIFRTLEDARSAVRHVFKATGNGHRNEQGIEINALREKHHITPREWPEPVIDWPWEPYRLPQIDGIYAILADLHIPFHDLTALLTIVSYLKRLGKELKGFVLNGDVMDCYSNSWWAIDPLVTTLDVELRRTRQFFLMLGLEFPNRKKIWNWSNHEYRFERTVISQNAEMFRSQEVRNHLHLLTLLKSTKEKMFDDVEVVDHYNPIFYKDLAIMHGHEYSKGASMTVNPARTAFMKLKSCAFVNHSHQSSTHGEQDIFGRSIACKSGGCVCDMHPRWNRVAALKWNLGFALLDTRGKWDIQNLKLINGEVVTA